MSQSVLRSLLFVPLFCAGLGATAAQAAPPVKPPPIVNKAPAQPSGGGGSTGGSKMGLVFNATAVNNNGNTIPPWPEDKGQVCVGERSKDAYIRDRRTTTPLRCRYEQAKHNYELAKKRGDDSGMAELSMRQFKVYLAEVDLSKATDSTRSKLEKDLNNAVTQFEIAATKEAKKARERAEKIIADAQAAADKYKKEFDAAVGKAKDQARAKMLSAEKGIKRLEEKLSEMDMDAAARKLEFARKRVGEKAKELEAKAQAAYDSAKTKYEDTKAKVAAAIASLEKELTALKKKLEKMMEDAEKAVEDLEKGIEEGIDDLEEAIPEIPSW